MSDKIFVHYPSCASERIEEEFNNLIRMQPAINLFRDRIEISSTPHALKQLQGIEKLPKRVRRGGYPVYALLFMVTRWSLPPAPSTLQKNPMYREDKLKLRYHAKEIYSCGAGVFVPTESGKWTYDMWRNARRFFQQGKPVWQIVGSKEFGWCLSPLESPPPRALRLNRKDTLYTLGLYAEPRKYPSLFTIIRDAFKKNED